VSPDNLAYLVYTSGSSGDPKAVEVPHRGLMNHAIHLAKRMGIEPGDRQIQNLSLNFDASAEEIFPTLIAGGTVVVNPAPSEMTAAQLLEFCQQHRVDILHVVAPMWHQLVEVLQQQGPQLFAGLKTVVTGADSMSSAALATWCRFLGARLRLLFIYGVTEATITTTIFEVPPEFTAGQRVPIGKPIANHRVYVLDRHFQPVPIGAVGELFIGGVGVARGYRHRHKLSESKFLDDPFPDVPGSRMYRTGDHARWRSDGNLEFLGRVDEQLKVRGYRIEPGEIESVLSSLETVAVARVIARQDRAGRRLVAYVVPAAGHSPTPAELRSAAADLLPQHMVPAAFVLLPKLPLSPGGKVDLSALPAPEWFAAPADQHPVAPRTDAEAVLAKIWADLLQVDQVSVEANFFELGGDSILSLQVVGRASAAGLQITPKQLLQHQTIAELAAVAQPAPAAAAPAVVTGDSPLSPIQRQFFAADLAQPNHFNQGVLLSVNALIAADVIEQAWATVVAHHDTLCSLFAEEDGRWQQRFTGQPNGADRVSRVDLAAVSDGDLPAEIKKLGRQIQSRLDPQRGPIAAAAYLDLGERRAARLLLAIHHLVVDAVSWRILIEDLHHACQQLVTQTSVTLPPKTTSFKTWVERLHKLARDPQLHQQAAHWLRMSDVARLPMDSELAENRAADVDQVVYVLSAHETHALLTDVQLAYRTRIDEVLLAALAQALSAWSGAHHLRIDCERHGRDHTFADVDVSRTVGWFTSYVPVAIDVPRQYGPERHGPNQAGPAALLCAVKEQLRAVPQQGMGYGLARWLAPDLRQDMARLSPADISFNYLGQLDASAADDGLFSLATEPIGPLSHGDNRRWHLLEVIAHVQNGRLHVELTYNRQCHHRETMRSLLDGFASHLGELIQHCLDPAAGQFTASDFPLAGADQEDLATLTRLLNDDIPDGGR
jgi:amino acid adenylation domain-containing protein/non-ribosomal peptide synthase protein (TIGR01720 family)